MSNPLISFKGTYQNKLQKRVSMDIELNRGEIFAISGTPNSGKTHLLRVLAGLKSCTTLTINGVSRKAYHGSSPTLDETRTLFQNFHDYYETYGQRVSQDSLNQILGSITEYSPEQPLTNSSPGLICLLSLVRVLGIPGIEVFFLDEPTMNLDETTTPKFNHLLQVLLDRGAAVVVVSNDPRILAQAKHTILLSSVISLIKGSEPIGILLLRRMPRTSDGIRGEKIYEDSFTGIRGYRYRTRPEYDLDSALLRSETCEFFWFAGSSTDKTSALILQLINNKS